MMKVIGHVGYYDDYPMQPEDYVMMKRLNFKRFEILVKNTTFGDDTITIHCSSYNDALFIVNEMNRKSEYKHVLHPFMGNY